MIKERLGDDLDRHLLRAMPFVARLRVRPDLLTTLGTVFSLFAAVAFALGAPRTAGFLMLAAGFFDLVDGVVARSQGTASTWGAFYDSTMDRLSDLLVFSGLAIGYARSADIGGVALTCAALIGSVMTSYTRARAEKHVASLSVGLIERGERWGTLLVAALIGWVELGLWLIAIGSAITTVQRLIAARRVLEG